MKVSVQYSTMIVKDMEKSVEFYRDILGFRESYHVDTPDGGSHNYHEKRRRRQRGTHRE